MKIRPFFRTCFFLLIAAAFIESGCSDKVGPSTSSSTTGTITGTVLDSVTHVPLAGAFIALYSASDTVLRDSVSTDQNGRFSFVGITTKAYLLVVVDSSYSVYMENLMIQAGSNIQRTIYLSHFEQSGTQTSVAFHVESAITGEPVRTATVGGAKVDSNGNAVWYGYASEQLTYGVSAPGYDSVTASVYMILNEKIFDTIRLVPHVDTLLAEYTFNNSSVDSSGKGHDGTLHGGTFTYDRFGNATSALQLNGTTNYISVPNASDLNFGNSESFTLSFWVKCQAQNPPSNTHYLLFKADTSQNVFTGYSITNSEYDFSVAATTTAASFERSETIGDDNQWHFIVYVFDGSGSFVGYYDDVAFGSESDSPVSRTLRGMMIDSAPLLIGGDGTANHAFKGILDDIRIYRGWLLPSQIDSLYHLNGWK